MKKKLIVPALLLVVSGAGVLGASQAYAQTQSGTYPPVVQKLVQKFGLNESEVKAVFDEERAAREAEMKLKIEERLNQEVQNGKLTQEQKQKILSKLEELRSKAPVSKEQLQSMTPEQRRAEHQKMRTELEQWAKDNGVDFKYLHMGKMGKGHKGAGMGFGRQMR